MIPVAAGGNAGGAPVTRPTGIIIPNVNTGTGPGPGGTGVGSIHTTPPPTVTVGGQAPPVYQAPTPQAPVTIVTPQTPQTVAPGTIANPGVSPGGSNAGNVERGGGNSMNIGGPVNFGAGITGVGPEGSTLSTELPPLGKILNASLIIIGVMLGAYLVGKSI